MKPIVVTSGEPAGIGPDLCALLAASPHADRLVVLGDRSLIAERGAARGIATQSLNIGHVPLAAPARPGVLDPANSAYVLKLLDRALAGCLSGDFAAMVTAPLHKGVINDARLPGPAFTGHTEYLAQQTGTPRAVMLLTGGEPPMRVALATTHLALREVPGAITGELLAGTLRVLHQELVAKFGIAHPTILVAGLNPHAGEGGHLGREEIEVIAPALDALRREGLRLVGPLPADTLFTPQQLARGDAVLAMYHDQGLAVLKHASFGRAVNVTLGLPVIRTSVDHGTALDVAKSGAPIDCGSMYAALDLAIALAGRAPPEAMREPAA
ncbi:MAG TPA: 4-hydroxythreonine-4-phosphate dehydrogenase PdxA [Usitatibacteraceae bacterium]|nr:4-hydroxythreonine-4-phosphate dehydrogenase PdxA [Usitatibacteraceae bacterium]